MTIIGVVTLIQPWQSLTKERFATAIAFERAFGSRALVQLIMFAVLLSLVKIFNGNFLTSTRLLFAMGRRKLLDPRLARVDDRFGFAEDRSAVCRLRHRGRIVPWTSGEYIALIVWLMLGVALWTRRSARRQTVEG